MQQMAINAAAQLREEKKNCLQTNFLPSFSLLVAPNGFLFFFFSAAVNGTLPPFIVALTVSLPPSAEVPHCASPEQEGDGNRGVDLSDVAIFQPVVSQINSGMGAL